MGSSKQEKKKVTLIGEVQPHGSGPKVQPGLEALVAELVGLDKEVAGKIEELKGLMVKGGNPDEYIR